MSSGDERVPCLAATPHDFWDKPIAHVTTSDGSVKVCLEDVAKEFSGVPDVSNLRKALDSAVSRVMSGAFPNRYFLPFTCRSHRRLVWCAGGEGLPADDASELRSNLPTSEITKYNIRLDNGRRSKKLRHAVPQMWAKRFLVHFFPRSSLVRQHADESIHLDAAVRGGTLAAAGAVLERNAELRDQPEEQAAQLGGTGISVDDANAPPVRGVALTSENPFLDAMDHHNVADALMGEQLPELRALAFVSDTRERDTQLIALSNKYQRISETKALARNERDEQQHRLQHLSTVYSTFETLGMLDDTARAQIRAQANQAAGITFSPAIASGPVPVVAAQPRLAATRAGLHVATTSAKFDLKTALNIYCAAALKANPFAPNEWSKLGAATKKEFQRHYAGKTPDEVNGSKLADTDPLTHNATGRSVLWYTATQCAQLKPFWDEFLRRRHAELASQRREVSKLGAFFASAGPAPA